MATSRRAEKAVALFCLIGVPACSLFVSLDGLTDGGTTDGGGVDAAIPAIDAGDGGTSNDAAAETSGIDAHVTTPPQFRAFALASNSSVQNTVTVDRPPQVTSGDFMIAQVYEYVYGSTAIAPSGWTKILTVDDPGPSYEVFYYEKFESASDPPQYAFTVSTADYASVTLVAYSGVSATKPVDASASALVSNSASYQGPALSTDVDNTLVAFFAVADGQAGATWGALDGLTQRSSAGYVFSGDVERSGTGAVGTLAATCSVQSSGGIALLALTPE